MASYIKASSSGNKQTQKNITIPMTDYELLMHLNTEWIDKCSQQKNIRYYNTSITAQNKIM